MTDNTSPPSKANLTKETKKSIATTPPQPKYPQAKATKFNLNSGAIKKLHKAAARGR